VPGLDAEQPPQVFVVDDDAAVRESLCALLASVGISSSGFESADEFLSEVRTPQVGCVLVDLRMPGMSGLELMERLSELQPHLPVIIVTGHGDVPVAVRALTGGANYFFEKPFNEQELLDRVHSCIDQSVRATRQARHRREARAALRTLTRREHQVLEHLLRGEASKQMAAQLGISRSTVDVHRSRLMSKLGVGSLVELTRLMLSLERERDVAD
jgi:FixJ family two-component response regulator